jgi:hypothetical protein
LGTSAFVFGTLGLQSRGRTLKDFEVLQIGIFGIDVELDPSHWDVEVDTVEYLAESSTVDYKLECFHCSAEL